jgi:hypothetical protein
VQLFARDAGGRRMAMPCDRVTTKRACCSGQESAGRSPSSLARRKRSRNLISPRRRRANNSSRIGKASSLQASAALTPMQPCGPSGMVCASTYCVSKASITRRAVGCSSAASKTACAAVALERLVEQLLLVAEDGIQAGPVHAHGFRQFRQRTAFIALFPRTPSCAIERLVRIERAGPARFRWPRLLFYLVSYRSVKNY